MFLPVYKRIICSLEVQNIWFSFSMKYILQVPKYVHASYTFAYYMQSASLALSLNTATGLLNEVLGGLPLTTYAFFPDF